MLDKADDCFDCRMAASKDGGNIAINGAMMAITNDKPINVRPTLLPFQVAVIRDN